MKRSELEEAIKRRQREIFVTDAKRLATPVMAVVQPAIASFTKKVK